MKHDEKERLTMRGDSSDAAISWRLRAAETVVGLPQKELAEDVGIKKTTLNSQIVKGRPSIALMSYLYGNHRIDFNFVLNGDFAQLPADVQARLLTALAGQER